MLHYDYNIRQLTKKYTWCTSLWQSIYCEFFSPFSI